MSRIASNIDPNSENFKRYHAFNRLLAAQLQARIAQTRLLGRRRSAPAMQGAGNRAPRLASSYSNTACSTRKMIWFAGASAPLCCSGQGNDTGFMVICSW